MSGRGDTGATAAGAAAAEIQAQKGWICHRRPNPGQNNAGKAPNTAPDLPAMEDPVDGENIGTRKQAERNHVE